MWCPWPAETGKSVHLIQYELLSATPYRYTHEDLLYEVHVRPTRRSRRKSERPAAQRSGRNSFENRIPACERRCYPRSMVGVFTSTRRADCPLPVESDAYRRFAEAEGTTTLVRAMRDQTSRMTPSFPVGRRPPDSE